MSKAMSTDEWKGFVSEPTRTDMLATVRAEKFGRRNAVLEEISGRIPPAEWIEHPGVAE